MLRTSLWAIQTALYSRLTNDTALMSKIHGVYDQTAPTGVSVPFVTLGNDTVNDYSTKTNEGEEVTHTLHVWSEYGGKKETKEVLDLVLQAVTKEPFILADPFSVDWVKREYMEVLDDNNGFHGVLRLRFHIKQL